MTHLLMGKAHLIQGDYEAARREIEAALALKPDNEVVLAFCQLYLARICAATGQTQAARDHYQAVLGMGVGGEVTTLAKEELASLASR